MGVIRSGGWSPREWKLFPCKRDHAELSRLLYAVCGLDETSNPEESPHVVNDATVNTGVGETLLSVLLGTCPEVDHMVVLFLTIRGTAMPISIVVVITSVFTLISYLEQVILAATYANDRKFSLRKFNT